MAGLIKADPPSLIEHAGELRGFSGQLEQQAYQLRAALGFVINRPDIPNGAALQSSYMSALQALDAAAQRSGGLSVSLTSYARRVVDCENNFLASGDGPFARAMPRGPQGLPGPGKVLGGLQNLLEWPLAGWNALAHATQFAAFLGRNIARPIRKAWRSSLPRLEKHLTVRILNYGSVDELAAIKGISRDGAEKIVAGRRHGAYTSLDDLAKTDMTAGQIRAARPALEKRGTAARIRAAERVEKPAGKVTKGAGKVAKAIDLLGKVVAPIDAVISTKGAWDELTDKGENDPNKLGPDWVENTAAVAGAGSAVGGVVVIGAVAAGVVVAPAVGIGLAVVGAGALAYEYGPRVWAARDEIGDAAKEGVKKVGSGLKKAGKWVGGLF